MAVSLVRGKKKRINEKKGKIQEEEKALLVFLEERRERRAEMRQVMEKKKEGRPEDGGMQDGKWEREEMKIGKRLPGNTFARLFWCIFHMSRRMERAKEERGKGERRRKDAGRSERPADWQLNGLPAPMWKKTTGAKDSELLRYSSSEPRSISTHVHAHFQTLD